MLKFLLCLSITPLSLECVNVKSQAFETELDKDKIQGMKSGNLGGQISTGFAVDILQLY